MQLAEYFKTIEKSEIIISIFFGCFISSILYHSFGSNSTLSVLLGFLSAYIIVEVRKSKKIVPSILVNYKLEELENIVKKNKNLDNFNLEFIKKYPNMVESLNDCINNGNSSLSEFTEAIIFTNDFCRKIYESNNLLKSDPKLSLQKYNDAKLLLHEILNSLHSLVHVLSFEDSASLESNIYSVRKEIRSLLKNTSKKLKLIDKNANGSYTMSVPSSYYFLNIFFIVKFFNN